jgi:hypothetical protein
VVRGFNDTVCVSRITWLTWHWKGGGDRLALGWKQAGGERHRQPPRSPSCHGHATTNNATTSASEISTAPQPKTTLPLLASLERSPSLPPHSTRRAGASHSTDAGDPSACRAHGSVEAYR